MPAVNVDIWRTYRPRPGGLMTRANPYYPRRIPIANLSPLETDPRNHLQTIHRPQYNDPRADYGFHVIVVVGGTENVLHPSSKLLTKLKSSINL